MNLYRALNRRVTVQFMVKRLTSAREFTNILGEYSNMYEGRVVSTVVSN